MSWLGDRVSIAAFDAYPEVAAGHRGAVAVALTLRNLRCKGD